MLGALGQLLFSPGTADDTTGRRPEENYTLTAAEERERPKRKHIQVATVNLACRAPRWDHARGLFRANGFIYQRQRFDMEELYKLLLRSREIKFMIIYLSLTNPNA